MKYILITTLTLTLVGCSSYVIEPEPKKVAPVCIGNPELPQQFASQFEKIKDDKLLQAALGDPEEGKLCQGQVYQNSTNAQITLYRAWNSTNPHSKLGKWWAFEKPAGKISTYRAEYEICYQWSPLDMLVSCTLKPNTKVVIGTGQSAECSQYLTYPASKKKQIYIADASTALLNCRVLSGEFSWK